MRHKERKGMTSIHDHLYDNGKPSFSEIVPTQHDHLRICDTTYYCVKDAEDGLKWTTTAPLREDDRDHRCKVDSLHALAKVMGCNDSIKNARPECKRSEEPCLTNGNGQHTCVLKTSKSLPNTFMADMTCADFRYDNEKHTVSRYQAFGENAIDTAIIVPQAAVPQCVGLEDDTPRSVGTQKSDTQKSDTQKNDTQKNDTQKSDTQKSDTQKHARCEWWRPGKTLGTACNVDSDCEPTNEEIFSAWWGVAHKGLTEKVFPTLRDFISAEKRDAANTEMHYDVTHTRLKDDTNPESKIVMRNRLKELYDDDSAFRTSLRDLLRQEDKYKHIYGTLGKCNSGKCVGSRAGPTQTLFDKSRDIPLSLASDDNGNVTLMYTGLDGMMHSLRSQSCEVDKPPQECESESVPNIQGLLSRADSHPVSSTYKVVLPDESIYLVNNAITVSHRSNDDETRLACATELCKRNTGKCPASHCRISGEMCVPIDAKVPSVQIHDAIV